MSLASEHLEALNDQCRQLVARCRAMPRGKERNKLELELGEKLKKADKLLLKMPDKEPEKCPT